MNTAIRAGTVLGGFAGTLGGPVAPATVTAGIGIGAAWGTAAGFLLGAACELVEYPTLVCCLVFEDLP